MNFGQYVASKQICLRDGKLYPAVGLSTFKLRRKRNVRNVLNKALVEGFRLFDTTPSYCNETEIGKILRKLLLKYNLTRKDIFISSKLITLRKPTRKGVFDSCLRSLKRLGLDYIDVFLINASLLRQMKLARAWLALQDLQQLGLVVSIGVANFSIAQIEMILNESNIAPTINQVELNPLTWSESLYKFCIGHGIMLQAYCPFGDLMDPTKTLFHHKLIVKLASKYKLTVQQVLLTWNLQHEVMVLPATSNTKHVKELVDFTLKMSFNDMGRISALAGSTDDSDSSD